MPLTDPDLDIEARLAATGERKGLGAYYTPDWLVDTLLDLALDPMLADRAAPGTASMTALRVIDPTCGSGNFLVRVVDRIMAALERTGLSPDAAGAAALNCVVGVDLEPRAIEACRKRLLDTVERRGGDVARCGEPRLWVADVFTMSTDRAVDGGPCWGGAGFDLVIGNPPFLNQLRSDTVFAQSYAETLRDLYPGLFRGYTDAAALALVVARRLVRDGGKICLIQPTSTLASANVAPIRELLNATATMTDAWLADGPVFDDAVVDVWAPVFTATPGADEVRIRRGREHAVAATIDVPAGSTWSPLLAAAKGVPQRRWATAGTLGDIATATADFRDQYYGLVGHVVDDADGGGLGTPKLVTSGLIDPADLMWGRTTTRFAKAAYLHPRVKVADLDEPLRRWAAGRLVPKVLVATQTKVLEAIVDEFGELLPSVPVITLVADPDDLWKVAALLASPPACAIAASRHMGSALSNDALKLSASDLSALPLPSSTAPWDRAAQHFRAASHTDDPDERRRLLIESAAAMCAAFGRPGDDDLIEWWAARLPHRSASTPAAPDSIERRRL